MPNLLQSLQGRDLGHLRIVAGLWGVEPASVETEPALQELCAALLDPGLAGEMVETLPASARAALQALAEAGGKMPWVAFARPFGELRETGPGRRDREQVYLQPISAAETLFYRAFLARAFFDTPNGPQEFAYIPEDLLEILQPHLRQEPQGEPLKPAVLPEASASGPLGRPANPAERRQPIPRTDRLLDDATTYLAALRMGLSAPESSIPAGVIAEFLQAAGIVVDQAAQPGQVKAFLEMPRPQALDLLGKAWRLSESFNELHQVPGLVCEGEWTNQPRATRLFLLQLLEALPEGKWWSLPAFIHAIHEKQPDFQRPAGDYDSWFIKRRSDGAYLRGFESWDEVEGALIRYFITGPMSWLGLVELSRPEETQAVSAFRLIKGPIAGAENGKLTVTSNGRISIPRLVRRAARYQIARFCAWEPSKAEEYRYRLTTGSLEKAKKQGLKVGQLLTLLAGNAASPLPPAFVRALKRWQQNGTEARLEVQMVLRVNRPEVLEELRKSRAGRFLGESLGPTAVIVKPGARSNVLAALAELGLLAEAAADSETDKQS
jgi:hypothetical protein